MRFFKKGFEKKHVPNSIWKILKLKNYENIHAQPLYAPTDGFQLHIPRRKHHIQPLKFHNKIKFKLSMSNWAIPKR